MLVLSRKTKEAIVIGRNIEVMIVAVQGDRVKLDIPAPASVPIQRAEVHQRITAEATHSLAHETEQSPF